MSPKIIKSDIGGPEETSAEAPSSGAKVVRRAVFETGIAADDILEQARQRAAEIVAEAEARRDEIVGEAREEGIREGLATWNEALAQIARERDKNLSECEAEVLQLAVRIAEKIIGESLKLDPSLQVSMVREGLKSVRNAKAATIRVHPDAKNEVESKIEELRREMPAGCAFIVKADDAIDAGGCVIQTDTSTVNASLRDQLRYFEERFLRESKR